MPKQITLLDDITLSFPVPGRHDTGTFHGAVRNTLIDREKIALGIEFTNMDPILLACIDTHIRDNRGLNFIDH